MKTTIYSLDSFIGKSYLALAKRYCKPLIKNTRCKAILDGETFWFTLTDTGIYVCREYTWVPTNHPINSAYTSGNIESCFNQAQIQEIENDYYNEYE